MKSRMVSAYLQKKHKSRFGRIMVITGARQTGKTTLVAQVFPDHQYLSIEDPTMRENLKSLTAAYWKEKYPKAILDEVQKEPQLIESIKSVYDQWSGPAYILLGSSQLLLMEKVRESLAGRCMIAELFPLTLPELRTTSWDDQPEPSAFIKLLQDKYEEPEPSFQLQKEYSSKMIAYEHYLKYGGYPAVSDSELTEEEIFDWLNGYVQTYLERDIRDLANFRDLDPFIKLQRYIAQNTGEIINASSVAKQLGVSVKTVFRYMRYLDISYQTLSLPSWTNNINKRLVKNSKIHILDHGILQAVLKRKGGLNGHEFESAIVSEIYKQAKNNQIQCNFSFLKTHDGREVDLLLEFPEYYYAFEIKLADKVSKTDARHLVNLEVLLDKPVKKSFILSNDPATKQFDENVTAIHAAMFLG
ncbi:MAG TPA: ATP-binding protein [Bacteroidales bacterium]|nr:ATP-binding protein [Bacteroidales bacterium]